MGLNPNGRDWTLLVNWDDLGKAYAGGIIAWTVVLYTGVAWLVRYRHLPFVKIRNLPLAIASTTFLHIFLVITVLAYITNGHFLCSAEFWIMSIYLPFGIALFQASLLQLRCISDQQHRLLSSRNSSVGNDQPRAFTSVRGVHERWQRLSATERSYVYIGLGMGAQLIMTAALYATSPTLQGHWQKFGNVFPNKAEKLCRKTPQWIPSAFWQLAWTWCYGPLTLYSIRNIHDVHHWRLQVILSVASGLPGTPLWLAATHSQRFSYVNLWWVPPMWLVPGIIVMQFVTIFFPVIEGCRSQFEMRKTLSLIREWEHRQGVTNSGDLSTKESPYRNQRSFMTSASIQSMGSNRSKELYSKASLDKALALNPKPLLNFAATQDFTAENILFLVQVRRWKTDWATAPRSEKSCLTRLAASRLYQSAREIYCDFVSERTAGFPINIESKIRSRLEDIFDQVDNSSDMCTCGERSSTPASATTSSTAANHCDTFRPIPASTPATVSYITAYFPQSTLDKNDPAHLKTIQEADRGITWFQSDAKPSSDMFEAHPCVVPLANSDTNPALVEGFNKHVFDAAEASIKYLVFTNTWQKFVRSEQWRTDGDEASI